MLHEENTMFMKARGKVSNENVEFFGKAAALIELTRRESGELNGKAEKNTSLSGATKLKVEPRSGKIISRRPCHFLG